MAVSLFKHIQALAVWESNIDLLGNQDNPATLENLDQKIV